jgi:hypothetical protein
LQSFSRTWVFLLSKTIFHSFHWKYLIQVFGNAIMFFVLFSLLKKTFNQELLIDLIEKTKQKYVLSILTNYVFVSANLLIFGCLKECMMFLHWLWIFKNNIGCQNILQLACLKHLKLQANISKRFTKSFRAIWINKKKTFFYVKDGVKYEYRDGCFEIWS